MIKPSRPVIGIGMDYQANGSFSHRPHYAIRTSYFNAVLAAGGFPLAIPYFPDNLIDVMLDSIDGFICPGGDYPYPASWYGADHGTPPPRFDHDCKVIERVLQRNMPFLGICAGMQTLAGVLGSPIHRDLSAVIPNALPHRGIAAEERAHAITIKPGTHLHRILGTEKLEVNSHHRECVAKPSDKYIVSATAPDGVMEAIEVPGQTFCIGVQWHPEFFITDEQPDFRLFQELIKLSEPARN